MPGNAGGIRAGRAFVEAGLEDAGLRAGLKAAEAKLKAFGAGIAGVGSKVGALGAAIVTPLLNAAKGMAPFIKGFADAGSELNDMSARTGVSVEALSALGHAADQTGADMGSVETGVRKMQKAIAGAAGGSIEAQVALGKLGLSVGQLAGMKPEDQFAAIAKRIAMIQDPTAKAASAMEIFGKSGTSLIPMIDDLDALTAEAKKFGLVWTGDEAKAADDLGDALDLVWQVGTRVFQVIGSALAPVLTDLAGTIARVGKQVMDWVNENKALIVVAFKVGAGLVVAGAAFVALGVAISGVGAVLGGIATAFGVVMTVLGAILSPIGLITAGLVAGGIAFFKYTSVGQQSLSWLGDLFGQLKADALAAFGGIADALKAGDIGLAAQVLWQALKVQWIKGTQFLKAIWIEWTGVLVSVFSDVSFSLSRLMTDAWAAIQTVWVTSISSLQAAWIKSIGFMQDTWSRLSGFIQDIWGSTIGSVLKILNNFVATFTKEWLKIKALTSGKFLDNRELIASIQQINVEAKTKNAAIDAINAAQTKGRGDQLAEQQKGRAGQLSALGQGQEATLGQIEADRAAAQKSIDDQQQAVADARRKAAEESAAAGTNELANAEAKLEALLQEAKDAGDAADKLAKAPKLTGDLGMPDLGEGLKKIETKGTFSAAALRGIGIGEGVDPEAKKQTKLLEKIEDRLRRSGPLVANEP